MRRVIINCDCCGKEIYDKPYKFSIVRTGRMDEVEHFVDKPKKELADKIYEKDICDECISEIGKIVADMICVRRKKAEKPMEKKNAGTGTGKNMKVMFDEQGFPYTIVSVTTTDGKTVDRRIDLGKFKAVYSAGRTDEYLQIEFHLESKEQVIELVNLLRENDMF